MNDQQSNQEQERNAFVAGIYNSFHKQLLIFAASLCRQFGYSIGYADDALQELYRKLLYKFPPIATKIEKYGVRYLFSMVRTEVLNMDRKDKSLQRIHKVLGETMPKEASLYCYSVEESISRLLHDIEKLVSEEDLAILRHYLQGCSMKEIGELMAMNPSTVGVRIHRARIRLAPHLSGVDSRYC